MKFYYSAKQANSYKRGKIFRPYNDKALCVNRVLIDGQWRVYTERSKYKYSSVWDDVEFLGELDCTLGRIQYGPDTW
jgi:hypothetical protein